MDYSAYVCAGGLVLLSRVLASGLKHDVLDSILFSQLCACNDITEDMGDAGWDKVFQETLVACGWSIYDHRQQDSKPYLAERDGFTVEEALVDVLEKRLSVNQCDRLSSAMKMLFVLPESSPLVEKFQEYIAADHDTVRMQFFIVDVNGFLEMVSVSFISTEGNGHASLNNLFGAAPAESGMRVEFIAARFNPDIYSESREDIVQWLDIQRQASVALLA
ncbi:hypothetical protein [Pseudomonas sp. TWP3-2]|uniref:hypothetical protein n=1 Tax=Pseudomonas sp. TWP3-2 TaxID=2804574 RepID=UPI003CF36E5A